MLGISKFKKAGIIVRPFGNATHLTINTEYGMAFQSYNSIVAFKDFESGKTYLGKDWDYSRTTMKYLGQWLGLNAKEIRKKLKDGEFILDGELK
jgi:retron-type reverse transcriptase